MCYFYSRDGVIGRSVYRVYVSAFFGVRGGVEYVSREGFFLGRVVGVSGLDDYSGF